MKQEIRGPLNIAVLTGLRHPHAADDKFRHHTGGTLTPGCPHLAAREIIVDDVDAIRVRHHGAAAIATGRRCDST